MAATLAGARMRAQAPPTARPLDVEVELSACAAVLDGSICELPDDGALRAWVHAAPEAVTFATPASRLETKVIGEVDAGTIHQVVVPAGTTELRVVAKASGATRVLRLAPKSAPPWVAEVKAARQQGDAERAAALVRTAEASTDAVDRAFALGTRGRLEIAAGRQEAAFDLLRESARIHRQAGRLSDAADDSFALAFALNQRSHRYAEARAVLDDVCGWVAPYPDGRAREAYYRGTLATETGDARAALRLLAEARAHAARLGLGVLERNAINAYALQLVIVGRVREANELLRELETKASASADAPPCERVEIAINLGYGALLANAQAEGDAAPSDPEPALERALADGACKDVYLRTAALGNLALAALQRGDPALARERLRRAREGVGKARGSEVLFWHDLEGRIALAEGDGRRALAAFEEEARIASSMLSFESEWRALVGKGEALELLGKHDAAVESYRAAEERLTSLSFLVPLGEGRGTFVGDRARSASFAIDLLVRLGRAGDALAVARASRARVVAGLSRSARLEGLGPARRERWESALGAYREARAALDAEAKDDWELPRAELARARASRERREAELRTALDDAFGILGAPGGSGPANAPLPELPRDVVTLAFHPARKGWVGLVADGAGVSAFSIPRLAPRDDHAQMAERLLVPVRARLEHARRLRVLPYGVLRAVDFHALPFDGQPLALELPVEYPLDLPPVTHAPRASPGGSASALVIADPTLDLESARVESARVVRALRQRTSWEVSVLDGPRATSAAVLARLPGTRLLHYAGHGVFAGPEGWRSALPLAGGSHLAIGDVLASSEVPERVVLSGCETGRSADDAPAESLGLAQAFVVAGAEFVIAPVRPVEDAVAARMSEALYGGLAEVGDVDPAAVLREAQLRLRADSPGADWSAFRVLRR